MLTQMRAAAKSKWAAVLIAMLVMSFAIWGLDDIFLNRSISSVAKIGQSRVTVSEMAREFNLSVRELAQQSGGAFGPDQARQLGLDRQVLGRLVGEKLMIEKARDLRVSASDALIRRRIQAQEAFADPISGRFNADTYRSLLARNELTPAMFEDQVRADLVRSIVQSSTTAGVRAPDVIAATRWRWALEARTADVVILPPSAAPDPGEPDDKALAALHAETAARYTAPERRAFTLFWIDVDALSRGVEVSDEDVAAAFEARRESLSQPERRAVVEITAPDEAKAVEAVERLKAGEAPEAVAKALGLPAPIELDAATRNDFIDAAVASAAFALEQGAVSSPIQTPFAWSVVKVVGVTPAVDPDLAAAAPELRNELAREAAGAELFDRIDAFESARRAGRALEVAAAAAGQPVFSYPALERGAINAQGVRYPELLLDPAIMEAVFATEAGRTSDLGDMGEEGFFAVHVESVEPAALRPLEAVRAEVRDAWIAQNAQDALDDVAETVRRTIAEGASPAEAIKDVRGASLASKRFSRVEPGDMPREALTALFDAKVGDVVSTSGAEGARIVAKLTAIEAAPTPPAEEVAAVIDLSTTELSSDLLQLFAAGLQEDYTILTNDELFARAVGAEPET